MIRLIVKFHGAMQEVDRSQQCSIDDNMDLWLDRKADGMPAATASEYTDDIQVFLLENIGCLSGPKNILRSMSAFAMLLWRYGLGQTYELLTLHYYALQNILADFE